ncbi:MAG TPA: N-acyl homoserine lactonase family protein [Thermoleophilaceae bacterium]|jgi:glyoxylase-like metal-dependent hydrolase (beta-lactamase superfamily II)
MKIEMLDGGAFTSPAGLWRRDEDMDRRMRFPIPAYLIETADERILVDTGLHPEAAADTARRYPGAEQLAIFELELARGVGEQVDLATITRVVLTHLHFDHAGGLALLPPSVPIVVQRREWEAAHDADAVARNFYLPADYADVRDRVVLVDGDHDLFGDGSVELLLTPGHTPGHQSVRVGERVVIGGDVTHFASGLDDHRFPMFADDFAAQAASADRLRALRDAGAAVRPGHHPGVLAPGPVAV